MASYIYGLISVWTVLGIGWLVLDSILDLSSWSNFTTWVWSSQTLFFLLFLYFNSRQETEKLPYFLDGFFLPVLFACECTTAMAVVYMMVVEADMFQQSVKDYGAAAAWTGSFVVHYCTLVVLLIYMHMNVARSMSRRAQILEIVKTQTPYFWYYNVLFIAAFLVPLSYAIFFDPREHYGLPTETSLQVNSSIVAGSILSLLVFIAWIQDYDGIPF